MLQSAQEKRQPKSDLDARGLSLRRRRIYSRPEVARLLWLVSAETGVPPEAITARARGAADVALARQLFMYLIHVVLGFDYHLVGTLLGRNRRTIAHACGLIEDLRDRPRFDAKVLRIEATCMRDEGDGLGATHAEG